MGQTKPTTNKEFLMAHINDMEDQDIEKLYSLFNLGKHYNKTEIMKFCGEQERNFDTAYPCDYMRSIEEIYPNAKEGNYIFDYTTKTHGEMVNINDIFANKVLEFFTNI